jgi:hypothetical protein
MSPTYKVVLGLGIPCTCIPITFWLPHCDSEVLLTRMHRLLAHRLHTQILVFDRIPSLLRTARHVLFPTNTFPRHKQPVPSEEQVKEIRARCARTILSTIPVTLRMVYFTVSEEEQQFEIVDGWLSTLEDAYCNKHAVFALIESLVVRLMPELAAEDVETLLQDKIGLKL